MTGSAPPALSVRYESSQRTFAPGNDVVVGRDLRADIRVAHPLISRAHLLLRFDHGRWIAVDNGSMNGMYVSSQRVPMVDIRDGQRINVGSADGPLLTFEVGRHQGAAGRPPTISMPLPDMSGAAPPARGPAQTGGPPARQPPLGHRPPRPGSRRSPAAPGPAGRRSGIAPPDRCRRARNGFRYPVRIPVRSGSARTP